MIGIDARRSNLYASLLAKALAIESNGGIISKIEISSSEYKGVIHYVIDGVSKTEEFGA